MADIMNRIGDMNMMGGRDGRHDEYDWGHEHHGGHDEHDGGHEHDGGTCCTTAAGMNMMTAMNLT